MGTKAKVAVLAGGIGSEREVSLMSGQNIFAAVKKAGFKATFSDITPDDLTILDDKSIDIFFLALHGEFGEDGQVQRILEERGLCFTGSDSVSSELAFDKAASKEAFHRASVTAPRDVCIYASTDDKELSERISPLLAGFLERSSSPRRTAGGVTRRCSRTSPHYRTACRPD